MIQLYKPIAETPLQTLKRLRQQRPELADARLSYAGRLDPMACGILPVLVGEENDRREDFFGQDKTYVFTALFGVATDTFDLLGKPTERNWSQAKKLLENESDFTDKLDRICDRFVGRWEMVYPPYSAKTVDLDGQKRPLWKVARSGRLDEVTLPTKQVTIYDLKLLRTKQLSKEYLTNYMARYITKLDGDFRQKQILTEWKDMLAGALDTLPAAKFRLHCSAGTYVRRLAQEIGGRLGVGGTVFSLLRTGVGEKGEV
jgi:tRNA pseudouridine55 synthase